MGGGTLPGGGGTQVGKPPLRPGHNGGGGGGTLPGGYPGRVPPRPGQDRGGVGYPAGGGRGTQLGQHREYLLHGGRYASCVHAGGLSCYYKIFFRYLFGTLDKHH